MEHVTIARNQAWAFNDVHFTSTCSHYSLPGCDMDVIHHVSDDRQFSCARLVRTGLGSWLQLVQWTLKLTKWPIPKSGSNQACPVIGSIRLIANPWHFTNYCDFWALTNLIWRAYWWSLGSHNQIMLKIVLIVIEIQGFYVVHHWTLKCYFHRSNWRDVMVTLCKGQTTKRGNPLGIGYKREPMTNPSH